MLEGQVAESMRKAVSDRHHPDGKRCDNEPFSSSLKLPHRERLELHWDVAERPVVPDFIVESVVHEYEFPSHAHGEGREEWEERMKLWRKLAELGSEVPHPLAPEERIAVAARRERTDDGARYAVLTALRTLEREPAILLVEAVVRVPVGMGRVPKDESTRGPAQAIFRCRDPELDAQFDVVFCVRTYS